MSESGTRLDQAEARLDKAQATLDAVGRLLQMAEKTQSAAERAGADLRKNNVTVLASLAVLGVLVLAVRRRN
jgi:hypothetical protein